MPLIATANRIAAVKVPTSRWPASAKSAHDRLNTPPRNLKGFAALLCFLLLCGCSTFNRDWRSAAKNPAPANSVEGRWEGRWLSDANGHTGALRCLVTRVDEAHCRARFHAIYGKVLRFTYTVPLTIQSHVDGWEFDGEENLGKLAGGVYYYEGRANATNFSSTYRSTYDHGTFEMHRPE